LAWRIAADGAKGIAETTRRAPCTAGVTTACVVQRLLGMSLHHHHESIPSSAAPRAAPAPRPGRDEAPVGDDRVIEDAYRRFLRRTQDVAASGVTYPGGMTALIHDREAVTVLLVRLLHRQA
jgi:hypothetical protein